MTKTPAQKWSEQIAKYKVQCKKIIGASKSIRYAGVINEFGRTLTGTLGSNTKPLLNSEQVKNEFFLISTLMSLRKSPASAVGALNYVVLKHQKISIVAFQKGKITYYVSIDAKEKQLAKLVAKIKKLV